MASHRLALTTLLVAAAAVGAGCGSGKDTDAFLPADPPVAATPVAPAPGAPVIIGGPSQDVVAERDVAQTQAADAARAAQEAEQRRQEARRELREERERAERARKRAEQREAVLRAALRDARRDDERARPAAGPAPAARPAEPTIGASDVGRDLVKERNARSDAEARAAVVRQYELLNRRDARACDLLTPAALAASFGSEEGAPERCRGFVAALSDVFSLTIESSSAEGRRATLDVVVRYGESALAQTLLLRLVDGTWMIDRAERRDAR